MLSITSTPLFPSVPSIGGSHLSNPLEPQNQLIRSGAGNIRVNLLDTGVVDDMSGEVAINGANDEFHFCDAKDLLY